MRRIYWALALSALQSAIVASAEPWTEGDFLVLLNEDHPALAIVFEGVGVAEAEAARARAFANPVVDFEREAPEENPEVSTLSLAWAPPLDARRGPRVRAARAGLASATKSAEAARLDLRRGMREAFAAWAIASERRTIIETHSRLIDRLADRMASRSASGEESKLAARRVALAAFEIQAEMARADVALVEARNAAAVWTGRELSSLEPTLPELRKADRETLSVDARSDLAARRFDLVEAKEQRTLAGRFVRAPELRVGWQRIDGDGSSDDGPVLGLSWSFPLFDRDGGDRRAAQAALTAAQARLDLATRDANSELETARATYERLRESVDRSEQPLADADRVIESATASFSVGESRLTDLLETLRATLTAKLVALELYESALEAHRNLEVAAGRPLF